MCLIALLLGYGLLLHFGSHGLTQDRNLIRECLIVRGERIDLSLKILYLSSESIFLYLESLTFGCSPRYPDRILSA